MASRLEADLILASSKKYVVHTTLSQMRYVDTTVEQTLKGKLTWIQVDNTKERKEPLEFKVGEGDVIKGIDEGVVGMCLHEKAELIVSPPFAYGKRGAGRIIPPDTQIHYDLEVCAVNDAGSGIGEYDYLFVFFFLKSCAKFQALISERSQLRHLCF